MVKGLTYHDYVIKDGRLIGDFESMYRDCEDPWHQSQEILTSPDKAIALSWIRQMKPQCILELGTGLGFFANELSKVIGHQNVIGTDVSETAIIKARSNFPQIQFQTRAFDDFEFIESLKPDVIVMAEITWYVLPQLKSFIDFFKLKLKDAQLIHLLTTYGPKQQYGNEYFSDLNGVLEYFSLQYIQYGEVFKVRDNVSRTFFWGVN